MLARMFCYLLVFLFKSSIILIKKSGLLRSEVSQTIIPSSKYPSSSKIEISEVAESISLPFKQSSILFLTTNSSRTLYFFDIDLITMFRLNQHFQAKKQSLLY